MYSVAGTSAESIIEMTNRQNGRSRAQARLPRWVENTNADDDEAQEESTSEEEEEEDVEEQGVQSAQEEVDEETDDGQDNDRAASHGQAGPSTQRQKISISLGKKDLVCHVRRLASIFYSLLQLYL